MNAGSINYQIQNNYEMKAVDSGCFFSAFKHFSAFLNIVFIWLVLCKYVSYVCMFFNFLKTF